jgi:MFS family permease
MSSLRRVSELVRWRPATVELLRLPDYRNFWLSLACGTIALDFWYTAAFWFVLERSDSQLWVGLVGGVVVVPTIAFSLHGGAIADRIDPRRVLLILRGAYVSLAVITALLVTSDIVKPWHLVLVSLAVGTVGALGGPASRTLVVDLVGKRRLFGANALRLAAESASEIFGPLVVGVVIAASGVAPVSYMR